MYNTLLVASLTHCLSRSPSNDGSQKKTISDSSALTGHSSSDALSHSRALSHSLPLSHSSSLSLFLSLSHFVSLTLPLSVSHSSRRDLSASLTRRALCSVAPSRVRIACLSHPLSFSLAVSVSLGCHLSQSITLLGSPPHT